MSQTSDNHILPSSATLGALACRAGEITLGFFRKNFELSDKGNNQGIVTEADLASEQFIKQEIKANFPGHSILAEESGLEELAFHSSDDVPLWVVDPLDGTTNFSKGNPYYCVSIAFALRTKQGVRVLRAAIYHPPTGDLYTAGEGEGAFLNGHRIFVSSEKTLSNCSFATGFSYNKNESLQWVVNSLFAFQNRIMGMRINGAAALDLAMTARGIFQGFYEKSLKPWDTAAGMLLLKEAGAKVTNFEDQDFDPLRDVNIVASNPDLHRQILAVIHSVAP